MRRIPYLDNTAPRASPEQRDTVFLKRGFERLFVVSFISGEGELMNMREPRHHFALQAFGCPITFSMDE